MESILNLLAVTIGAYLENNLIKIAILGGILGFFLLVFSFKLMKNKITQKDMLYGVEIVYNNQKTKIKVILDTGNLLKDPITQIPVMIVEAEKLKTILPEALLRPITNNLNTFGFEEMEEDIKIRCNLIPFSSIGKTNGMLLGFRPDYIQIETPEGEQIQRKVIIGIYHHKLTQQGLYCGLIGLNLLNEEGVSHEII